jgi:indole-3-glycerol phosphate synthase
MNNVLREIIDTKKKSLEAQKKAEPVEAIKEKIGGSKPVRDFRKALDRAGTINIIAEIKKASPSAGTICQAFDVARLAREYDAGGAEALSVLTEEAYFKGDPSYLVKARENCDLPLLRKDFIFDPYQLYESRMLGADALLLIATLFETAELGRMIELAHSLGMYCLVEVHTAEDLEKTLPTPAEIIGINNRNLDTFSVDLNTGLGLVPKIPGGKTIVIESGIKTPEHIRQYYSKGVHAFLIGETLMRAGNIKNVLKGFKEVAHDKS